jgi:hypothetical protein
VGIYNLTLTTDIASKPTTQVPPLVLQASNQQNGSSSNESKGIGTNPIVIYERGRNVGKQVSISGGCYSKAQGKM